MRDGETEGSAEIKLKLGGAPITLDADPKAVADLFGGLAALLHRYHEARAALVENRKSKIENDAAG